MLESVVMWLAMQAMKAEPKPVAFQKDIQPILEQRCTPCHFPGGKMHAQLPFDKPETIHKLGTKLFTRIKDEREQKLIREFLADSR